MVCGLCVCVPLSFLYPEWSRRIRSHPQKSLYYRLDISKLVSDGRPLSILMMMMTLNEFFLFFLFFSIQSIFLDSHLHHSLCVADFSFCVMVMPFTAYRFLNDRNYFGDEDVMCISTYILCPNIHLVLLISFFGIVIVPNDPEIQQESLIFPLENPFCLSATIMWSVYCRVIIHVFLSISFFSIPWCFFLPPLLLDKRKYPP